MIAIHQLGLGTVTHRTWVIAAAVLLFTASMFAYAPKAHATTYGPYALISNQGKCMDVRDYSTSNGAVIQVYDCTFASNQNFVFYSTAYANVYTIRPTHTTGKCLDIKDASTSSGAQLQQWTCNGQANQMFQLQYVTNYLSYILPWHVSGKCLTPSSGGGNTAPIVQMACTGAFNQEWAWN